MCRFEYITEIFIVEGNAEIVSRFMFSQNLHAFFVVLRRGNMFLVITEIFALFFSAKFLKVVHIYVNECFVAEDCTGNPEVIGRCYPNYSVGRTVYTVSKLYLLIVGKKIDSSNLSA